eukprot:gene13199-19034_t
MRETNTRASGGVMSQTLETFDTVYTNAKAGMAGVDKERVKKGSVHWKHEQKRNQQTKERIGLMNQKASRLSGADLAAHARAVDSKIEVLEVHRDLSRTWLHVDMDAFFAAVHMLENPKLRDVPMAVGDMGMISTANYKAREYGVRSAMPGFIGKALCPHLVFCHVDFPKYQEFSLKTRDVFQRFDADFEAGSLDEAHLDVTEYCAKMGMTGAQVAEQLRHAVHQESGLTCSCGVAPNRMLAKICSDINKPNGQYILPPTREAVLAFISTLPVRKVPGVGRVSEQLLEGVLGIKACGDIMTHKGLVAALFTPVTVDNFIAAALGLGQTAHSQPPAADGISRKGISFERTFHALSCKEGLEEMATKLVERLCNSMAEEGIEGRTITLKLKATSFETRTRSATIPTYASRPNDMLPPVLRLLRAEFPIEVRLMGIRASNLRKKNVRLPQFFKPKSLAGHADPSCDPGAGTHQANVGPSYEPSAGPQKPDVGPSCQVSMAASVSGACEQDKDVRHPACQDLHDSRGLSSGSIGGGGGVAIRGGGGGDGLSSGTIGGGDGGGVAIRGGGGGNGLSSGSIWGGDGGAIRGGGGGKGLSSGSLVSTTRASEKDASLEKCYTTDRQTGTATGCELSEQAAALGPWMGHHYSVRPEGGRPRSLSGGGGEGDRSGGPSGGGGGAPSGGGGSKVYRNSGLAEACLIPLGEDGESDPDGDVRMEPDWDHLAWREGMDVAQPALLPWQRGHDVAESGYLDVAELGNLDVDELGYLDVDESGYLDVAEPGYLDAAVRQMEAAGPSSPGLELCLGGGGASPKREPWCDLSESNHGRKRACVGGSGADVSLASGAGSPQPGYDVGGLDVTYRDYSGRDPGASKLRSGGGGGVWSGGGGGDGTGARSRGGTGGGGDDAGARSRGGTGGGGDGTGASSRGGTGGVGDNAGARYRGDGGEGEEVGHSRGGEPGWTCLLCTFAFNRREVLRCSVCDQLKGSTSPKSLDPLRQGGLSPTHQGHTGKAALVGATKKRSGRGSRGVGQGHGRQQSIWDLARKSGGRGPEGAELGEFRVGRERSQSHSGARCDQCGDLVPLVDLKEHQDLHTAISLSLQDW